MDLEFSPLPKQLLESSYRDWTPAEAELAKQHFLEPLLPKPRYAGMSVNQVALMVDNWTVLSPEMAWLRDQALSYYELHRDPNSSTPFQEVFKKLWAEERAAREAAEQQAAACATSSANEQATSPEQPPVS